jgi:hypothetical protein
MRKGILAAGIVVLLLALIGAGVAAVYENGIGLGVGAFFVIVGLIVAIYGGIAQDKYENRARF